jgi:hypothetical protein
VRCSALYVVVKLPVMYYASFIKTDNISCRGVTHKNSVITFCTRKLKKAERNPELFDRESVILLWKLLILLLRQNGVSSSHKRSTVMCVAFYNLLTIREFFLKTLCYSGLS